MLVDLPVEAREQIVDILDDSRPEDTITSLYTLTPRYRRAVRYSRSPIFFRVSLQMLGLVLSNLDKSNIEVLQEEKLQATITSLTRMAAVLDYAAEEWESLEEENDYWYRNHYDPSQVNTGTIQLLLERLDKELDKIPDQQVRESLKQDVSDLKKEASRPRPRWRSFLGKAIIILAIAADIKTMHPEIGNDIIETIDSVIRTVVVESQASQNESPRPIEEGGPKHWAIVPKRIEYKPGDDEIHEEEQ